MIANIIFKQYITIHEITDKVMSNSCVYILGIM